MSFSASRAVATMTGTSDTDRIIRSSSRPSRSGRPRSRITTSGGSLTTNCNPSIAVAADRTTWPRSDNVVASAWRMRTSSSMMVIADIEA